MPMDRNAMGPGVWSVDLPKGASWWTYYKFRCVFVCVCVCVCVVCMCGVCVCVVCVCVLAVVVVC